MMKRSRIALVPAALLFFAMGCGEEEFTPTKIVLEGPESFLAGETHQLKVIAKDDAGNSEEVTKEATFTSSDERVASIEAGTLTVLAGGPVEITAEYEGLKASLESKATCTYPEWETFTVQVGNEAREVAGIGLGATFPSLMWEAKTPDGKDQIFNLKDVHCLAEWKSIKSINFVLSAIWCDPCKRFAQNLQNRAAGLMQKGMLTVIVELQRSVPALGQPANTQHAYDYLKTITNPIPGLSVGDLSGYPEELFFHRAVDFNKPDETYIKTFPSNIVVRTSDMKVIADGKFGGWQTATGSIRLPLEKVAENLDADWSEPQEWMFSEGEGEPEESEEIPAGEE